MVTPKSEVVTPKSEVGESSQISYEKKIKSRSTNIKKMILKILPFIPWVIIIPISSNFIFKCLNNFGIEQLIPIPFAAQIISVLLAVVVDFYTYLYLELYNRWTIIGLALIGLNCSGAYYLANLNSSSQLISSQIKDIEKFEKDKDELATQYISAKSAYLITKWPEANDPEGCELRTANNCGSIYATKAKTFKLKAFSLEKQIKSIDRKINNLKTTTKNMDLKQTSDNHVWWDLGFYITLWILVFLGFLIKRLTPVPSEQASIN